MPVYYFVGERRSATAIRKNWTWHDKRLAGKTLAEALDHAGVPDRSRRFLNWFEADDPVDLAKRLHRATTRGAVVVALGRKVEAALQTAGVPHLFMIHPAARGKIRTTDLYREHVLRVLTPGKPHHGLRAASQT